MAAVTIREGVKYGLSLLGYFVVLFIASGIIFFVGSVLFTLDNIVATLLGFLILVAGLVVLYGGTLGVGYKVIADGVRKGIQSVRVSSTDAESDRQPSGEGLVDSIMEEE